MRIQDIHFGYQPLAPVIRGITAELFSQRLCALIGPNAAGKSTLLKIMLGQLDANRGQVLINDRPVSRMTPADRAAVVAYVPQRAMGQVAFSVREVVALGRYALRRDENAIDQAMEMCELGDEKDRVFTQLSAGQQQRVALARAIAQVWSNESLRGKFMLLDEPVSAMDLRHVHHTMRTLRELVSRGLGVLMVMHDLNLAASYADQLWLMDEGVLRAAGPWNEVLDPAMLESVYQMKLEIHPVAGQDRPMLLAAASRTLK